MIIANILKRKGGQVFSVNPDDTIHQVAVTLAQHRIGAALVSDPQGGMLGIIASATSSAAWPGRARAPPNFTRST